MTNFTEALIKTCQRCGGEFTPRRSDAKYCSTKCKNTLNNNRYREEEATYQAIVGEAHFLLWKNRNVLIKYVGKSVSLSLLKTAGFTTNNITRFKKVEKGISEFLVYDVWYQMHKTKSGLELKIYKK